MASEQTRGIGGRLDIRSRRPICSNTRGIAKIGDAEQGRDRQRAKRIARETTSESIGAQGVLQSVPLMGYPLLLASRYLRAKKAAFVNVSTLFAILGVALGVCALATAMSVTGGFQAQFREKVLGVNAHVLVLKYAADFREYREIMKVAESVPGVTGAGPFTINPMMVSNGKITATGVLLKGVDPELMPKVLDLPKHIIDPADPKDAAHDQELKTRAIQGLRRPGAAPPKRPGMAPMPSTSPSLSPPATTPGNIATAPANTPGTIAPNNGQNDAKSPDIAPGLPNNNDSKTSPISTPPSQGTNAKEINSKDLPSADSGNKEIGPSSASATSAKTEVKVASAPVFPGEDPPKADIGLWDKADAGVNLSLMAAIDRAIEEGRKKQDAGAWAGDIPEVQKIQAAEAASANKSGVSPGSGPTGDAGVNVPEGGFKSVLPDDDDDVFDRVSPDPCKASEISKLPGIIIGASLARNLKLKLGDCLQVTSPTIGYSYSSSSIRPPIAKQFRVMAIFEAGFDQYDSKLVYTDLFEAQAFYDAGDSVTGIEMKVKDINQSKDVVKLIDSKLSNGIYHTMDWEELNHGLFTALKIQQIGMSAVLALIIVVAAFTVVATLIMVVLEKKKEIAVLKAMGATDNAILRTFLYQGGFIGGMGTLLGLAMAVGVCKGLLVYGFPLDPKVYFISRLPVDVRPTEFAVTGVIAIIICLIATIAPALYAAWLRPAEAVRDLG